MRDDTMKYVRTGLLLGLLAFPGGPARADIVINFDTDASGNPLAAPPDFNHTTALTTLYAPLGVTFSGPGGNDGGAILNVGVAGGPPPDESGGSGTGPVPDFGVWAHSGSNALAFNRDATLASEAEHNGGVPTDPETITFATPWDKVSIFASGGFVSSSFTMNGYDAGGTLVATDSVTTRHWAQLTVSSASDPIASVQLVETSLAGDVGNAFLYDDLHMFSPVPEPSTLALMGLGSAGWIGTTLLRRRRRGFWHGP
jgi:hypothetical protein